MSTAKRIEIMGLGQASAEVQRVIDRLDDPSELMENVVALVESSTRDRIASDKAGPHGEAWPTWSEGYAQTRHPGHALLEGEGHLRDSITGLVDGKTGLVGSVLKYAAIQHFGGLPSMAPGPAAVPAHPYLGLSARDEADLATMAADYLTGAFAA